MPASPTRIRPLGQGDQPLRGLRVVVDPGHGGLDAQGRYVTPGKRYAFRGLSKGPDFTIYEGVVMRDLAYKVMTLLHEQGAMVYDSISQLWWGPVMGYPRWQADASLADRVAFTNTIKLSDRPGAPERLVFLSLHSNAVSDVCEGRGQSKARGISVWTTPGQTKSDYLAASVWRGLDDYGFVMRGQSAEDGDPDYESGFYVLRNTYCPAILVEAGFHDNVEDARLLLDGMTPGWMAEGICGGVGKWFAADTVGDVRL